MILTCSSCKTQFAVPSSAVPPMGRKVKCSRCGFIWHQKPLAALMDVEILSEAPEKPVPIPQGSSLPSVIREANPIRRMRRSFAVLAAASVVLAVLSFREQLPFMRGFYTWAGLEQVSGLAFTNVSMTKKRVNNKYVLHLGGEITNESDETLSVPPLFVKVVSRGGNVLMSNEVTLPLSELKPGESVRLPDEITGISGSSDKLILDIGTQWELLFRQ